MAVRVRSREDMRGYQHRLSARLVRDFEQGRPGALLAVQMSLGKTVTVATAALDLLNTFQVRKVLIVAPLRVAQMTWPDEFAAWSHLRVLKWKSLCGTKIGQAVTAADRERWLDEFLADPSMEIAIINRENVVWLYKALQKRRVKWPFDMLIYDESSRLKEGKKVTATRRQSEFGVLAKNRQHMDYVVELTGTPTPKGVIDLWGQLYIIDLGRRLGSTKAAFLDRWFSSEQIGASVHARKYTPKAGAEKTIMSRLKGVMLSLKTKDVIELPPIVYANVEVDLSVKQMKDYRRFERELALEEHDIVAANQGVLTNKLLQFANGSVYRTDEDVYPPVRETIKLHNHKLDALESIVAETNGANLLVAYSFKFDRDAILKKFPFAREAEEEGALEAWNRGEVQMLVAHPASIGHGMNIQFGGHHIVWFGLTSSLELYQQFNARLPRPGQEAEKVFIWHILARGTFDMRLLDILQDRHATQERITDAVKWHLDKPEEG